MFAAVATAGPCLARDDHAATLRARYEQVRAGLRDTVFGAPIQVRSEVRADELGAEVYGIIDQPYARLSEALAAPASWCEFVPLHLNVKACLYRQQATRTWLTFYIGPKLIASPSHAFALRYRYRLVRRDPGYFQVLLTAQDGPSGTRDYRLALEAMPVDGGTFVGIRSSYRPSLASRIATLTYLRTAGRGKVGFSIVRRDASGRPVYVTGVQAVVERNVMRYYLALEAFLDTQRLPPGERFEARINEWFDLTERYPAQLHELDRASYLRMKREAWNEQTRWQRAIARRDRGRPAR